MKISKRLLAWALSLVITASAGIPAAAGEAGVPGDMNRDGRVTAADAVLLRQRVLKGGAAGRSLAAGDLDGSGAFTALDAVLLRKLLKEPAPQPGGHPVHPAGLHRLCPE